MLIQLQKGDGPIVEEESIVKAVEGLGTIQ